jgi:hypothetical protein
MMIRLLAILCLTARALSAEPIVSRQELLRGLAQQAELLHDIPFSEVIQAATGKQILPFDPKADPVAERIHSAVSKALASVLKQANAADSPLAKKKRINETSKWFEDSLCEALAQAPGFTCDFPQNAEGHVQRSGYPDIRLIDQASGRVAYLDPKVYAEDSQASSLRTFYYQPSVDGGKVREDAHHLILGIAHTGPPQKWKFVSWKIVDVCKLCVSLKAEFDAGNAELYQPELLRAQGK